LTTLQQVLTTCWQQLLQVVSHDDWHPPHELQPPQFPQEEPQLPPWVWLCVLDCVELFEFDADELEFEPDSWWVSPPFPAAVLGEEFCDDDCELELCETLFDADWD